MAFDSDAAKFLGGEGAEEQTVFPCRKAAAGVEGDRASGDRRHPIRDGLIHAGLRSVTGNGSSVVIHAVGDDGPAVVVAGFDDVEFVAAAGTVLGFPEFASNGTEGEALGIAVAVAPDRFDSSVSIDEGIVRGHTAIFVNAIDLAIGMREFLFVSGRGTVAYREEEVALFVKDQTRAKTLAAGTVEGGIGFEDLLLIDEFPVRGDGRE